MRIIIAGPAERDAMAVILVRNGYTVRQGRQPKKGSKTAKESYIEYWREEGRRDGSTEA